MNIDGINANTKEDIKLKKERLWENKTPVSTGLSLEDSDGSDKLSFGNSEKDNEKLQQLLKENKLSLSEFKQLISNNNNLNEIASRVGYGAMFSEFDKDNDGIIGSAELEKIIGKNNDVGNLKVSDFEKYIPDSMKSEKNGTSSNDNAKSEDTSSNGGSSAVSSSGGSYSDYSGGGSVGGSYGNYGMSGGDMGSSSEEFGTSAEALNAIATKKGEQAMVQEQLNTKNAELAAVNSDQDAEVASKKTAADEAKQKYDELCENESDEVKKLKEDQDKIEQDISKDNENITNAKSAIQQLDAQRAEHEAVKSGLEAEKQGLDGAVAEFEQARDAETDEEKKATYDAIIAEYRAKASQAEAQIKQEQDTLKDIRDQKVRKNNELRGYEEQKQTHEKQKEEIIDQIKEKCSADTKAALVAWEQAQEDYETTKSEKTSSLEQEISTLNNNLGEIYEKIGNYTAQYEMLKYMEDAIKAKESNQ